MNAMISIVQDALSREIGADSDAPSDCVFRARAVDLMRSLLPALDWLETHKEVPLNIDTIRSAFDLRRVQSLATQRIVLLQDRGSSEIHEFCFADDIPAEILAPLQRYVAELGILVTIRGTGSPTDDEALRQHGYLALYFAPGFTKLRSDISAGVH